MSEKLRPTDTKHALALYVTKIVGEMDAHQHLTLWAQTKYRKDSDINGQHKGHFVNSTSQDHLQRISLSMLNKIMQVNDLPGQTLPQLAKQSAKQPILFDLSNHLTFDAHIDTLAHRFDPQTIQKASAKLTTLAQDSGPSVQIQVPKPGDDKLKEAQWQARKQDHDNEVNRVTNSLAAERQPHQLAFNSMTSVADSIAHSPRQMTRKQQAKSFALQSAIDKYGTSSEKHVIAKLHNQKQTSAVQKQIALIQSKAFDRSLSAPTNEHMAEPTQDGPELDN